MGDFLDLQMGDFRRMICQGEVVHLFFLFYQNCHLLENYISLSIYLSVFCHFTGKNSFVLKLRMRIGASSEENDNL